MIRLSEYVTFELFLIEQSVFKHVTHPQYKKIFIRIYDEYYH